MPSGCIPMLVRFSSCLMVRASAEQAHALCFGSCLRALASLAAGVPWLSYTSQSGMPCQGSDWLPLGLAAGFAPKATPGSILGCPQKELIRLRKK